MKSYVKPLCESIEAKKITKKKKKKEKTVRKNEKKIEWNRKKAEKGGKMKRLKIANQEKSKKKFQKA